MEYIIFRVSGDGLPMRAPRSKSKIATTSEWYPRFVQANSPEEAVERMFEGDTGELRVAGRREFLVVPMYEAVIVTAEPKKEYTLKKSLYPGYEEL